MALAAGQAEQYDRIMVAWFWEKRDAFRFERREIMERRDSLTNVWRPRTAIEEPRSWSAELSAILDAFLVNDRAEPDPWAVFNEYVFAAISEPGNFVTP